MRLVALAVVSLLAQQTAPPPTPAPRPSLALPRGTAQVNGDLVDAKSGLPLAGATVQLVPMVPGQPVRPRSATSDDQGRFTFTEIPAGRYSLSVRRPASMSLAFGGGAPNTLTVDLSEDARRNVGTLRIPSFSDVTGQILDEHGKPIGGATVRAGRLTYLTPGERRLFVEGSAQSNASGEFRIVGVKPGTYYIDARASDNEAVTFYPGVANAAMAQPVTVTQDVGVTVSLQLLASPLARVSGTVISSQGTPGTAFVVILAPVRDDGAQTGMTSFSEVDAAGKFSISKVPPGLYSANVAAKARLERMAQSGSNGVGSRVDGEESGSAQVLVDGRDVDDVVVTTNPLAQLVGKVSVDGGSVMVDLTKAINILVSGRSTADGIGGALNATFGQPAADGTLAMPVVPGARLLRVIGLPRGTVLKQVMVNGVDVTDEGFDVGGTGVRDVVVSLTTKPSRVEGRVVDSRGAAVAGEGVIVFAEDARKWALSQTRRVVSAKTDKDGAFALSGLPAGNYLIVGVAQLVDGEWAAPSNLEKLRVVATPFKLGDGEQKTMTLVVR